MYCLGCKGMTKKQELKIKIEKLYKKVKKQKSNALATTYKGRKEKHLQMIADAFLRVLLMTFVSVSSAPSLSFRRRCG
jgi:hypothetical protein